MLKANLHLQPYWLILTVTSILTATEFVCYGLKSTIR